MATELAIQIPTPYGIRRGWATSVEGMHGHSHGYRPASPRLRPGVAKLLRSVVGVVGVVTLVAVALLWPGGRDGGDDPLILDAEPIAASVVAIEAVDCLGFPAETCTLIGVRAEEGQYAGEFGTFEQGAESHLNLDDKITVTAFETESGEVVYSFFDYQRDTAMWWLLALFVLAVLALGRWRGVGAIAGLSISLAVIVVFALPAVLDGSNALLVAIVSASLIAFAALFLVHGFEISTAVALLSTLSSLVLTAILASMFVEATNLTGLTDDNSPLLSGLAGAIDARGILMAGIVIGALGVLDDVTVTQVSAVWELKRVQPDLSMREVVAPALRIGRDHISSTVNTLFFAYAGAALPLLLLFTEAGQGVTEVVTREVVAVEVLRALVGSIGLVASVPISTWLAAAVISESAEP